jgi:hypothetical protein
MTDWLDEELERQAAEQKPSVEVSGEEISRRTQQWWASLKESLQQDVERAAARGIDADLSEPEEGHIRVSNHSAGIDLDVFLDEPDGNVRFGYVAHGARAIAPEGGILTLRSRSAGRIQPFYSDQHLSREQLRETLLKPVLFPAMPTEEAA